jgi:hypothetical protein
MNLARERRGIDCTLTVNPHVAVRPAPSTAVQATAVAPDGNAVPAAGLHVVVTGAVPPLATGEL